MPLLPSPLDVCQFKIAENSREELCEVVRKKLDLDSKTNLELVQVRDGVLYDLEDGKMVMTCVSNVFS